MSEKKESPRLIKQYSLHILAIVAGTACVTLFAYFVLPTFLSVSYDENAGLPVFERPKPTLDKGDYDTRLLALAHIATSSPVYNFFLSTTSARYAGTTTPLWPIKTAYPNYGAILPFSRIVAYYGNFYSKGMGILGEYPEDVVLDKLGDAVAKWEAADPSTPVVPAIEYIDVTAQESAGKDGKYRARMQDSQIDKALEMAHKINGIVVLDIQNGFSTVQDELPLLKDYFAKPDVHLALDPEFSMKGKYPPGREIGTMSAEDINYAINYLSDIVKANDLPPKILVIHRFTEDMVTGYKRIRPTPEVQVVVQMDGWGSPQRKQNTYRSIVSPEPVQFTGLKLFYKNDLKEVPPRLLSMDEIFNLNPVPIYIQYQ